MKYLKIRNVGEIDVRSLMLIGASSKKEDSTKIGQFGTGLKYAISYFVRNGINFKIFKGTEEISFSTKDETIRDIDYKVIYCNGESMNITTQYGFEWQAWEAIREIWCNAKDEAEFSKKLTTENSVISGTTAWTTFYIEITDEVWKVIENWDNYFISRKPLFESDKHKIYDNPNKDFGCIYKNGILIKKLNRPSLFHYDIKDAQINELRQFTQNERAYVAEAIMKSSDEIVKSYMELISTVDSRQEADESIFEDDLDFSYSWLHPKASVLKENFKGFMFLHPESDSSGSKRAFKVQLSLFNALKNSGLHCEKVNKTSNYGGGTSGVKYREFNDDYLVAKIESIKLKYEIDFTFKTAMPFEKKFNHLVDQYSLLFSSDLSELSDSDLEAVVLVAYADLHFKLESSFRRLLKASLNNKNLFNILGLKQGNKEVEVKEQEYSNEFPF